MTEAFEMQERKEPAFVKFADGEVVRGILIAIELAEVNQKKVARYTVQDLDSGERSCFLGTAQINSKLRATDKGHLIEVRCEGTDQSVIKNGNPMKKFRVRVSSQKATGKATDDTIITDDDIPF